MSALDTLLGFTRVIWTGLSEPKTARKIVLGTNLTPDWDQANETLTINAAGGSGGGDGIAVAGDGSSAWSGVPGLYFSGFGLSQDNEDVVHVQSLVPTWQGNGITGQQRPVRVVLSSGVHGAITTVSGEQVLTISASSHVHEPVEAVVTTYQTPTGDTLALPTRDATDGVALLTGYRVLVLQQSTAVGYVYTHDGTQLVRTLETETSGDLIGVKMGTIYGGALFQRKSPALHGTIWGPGWVPVSGHPHYSGAKTATPEGTEDWVEVLRFFARGASHYVNEVQLRVAVINNVTGYCERVVERKFYLTNGPVANTGLVGDSAVVLAEPGETDVEARIKLVFVSSSDANIYVYGLRSAAGGTRYSYEARAWVREARYTGS